MGNILLGNARVYAQSIQITLPFYNINVSLFLYCRVAGSQLIYCKLICFQQDFQQNQQVWVNKTVKAEICIRFLAIA